MSSRFNAAGPEKLRPTGQTVAAPRISINQLSIVPEGHDVTVVGRTVERIGDGAYKFLDETCGEHFCVYNVVNEEDVAVVMEMTIRPNQAGAGKHGYVNSGMLNDDFDIERYKMLLTVIRSHNTLFW